MNAEIETAALVLGHNHRAEEAKDPLVPCHTRVATIIAETNMRILDAYFLRNLTVKVEVATMIPWVQAPA